MAERFYSYCIECRIEFEPKTPFIHWGGYQYHHGCFKALEQRGGVIVDPGPEQLLFMREPLAEQIHDGIVTFKVQKCSHYTPAEDKSGFAYAHRTYGCPDEGAEWPSAWHGDLEEFRRG